jgi:hydrogenase maturation factor
MEIIIAKDILKANDQIAEHNRSRLDNAHVYCVNLLGSPGCGKTTLLEAISGHFRGRLDLAVIEGDLATSRDGDRMEALGIPAIQINTGGDIGGLAVNGTVNDLAMNGARPLFLSAGFILEEGLPMEILWRVAQSMSKAAKEAGVPLVTGDTKVVDKGKGDGMFVNTAGIGIIEHDLVIAPKSIVPGDIIILNGDIGRHGIAVMVVREGLSFESNIESDCAPLASVVMDLIKHGVTIHCMRDLTPGGLG